MRLDVFTLFPDAFAWFAQQVHVARAAELGVDLRLWD
jgi:tRNA G37 N-methylase TrmD